MQNLEKLDLQNNNIKDISCLEKLKNLKELNLQNNNITDISCLEKIRNLVLKQIKGIWALIKLQRLYKLRLCEPHHPYNIRIMEKSI